MRLPAHRRTNSAQTIEHTYFSPQDEWRTVGIWRERRLIRPAGRDHRILYCARAKQSYYTRSSRTSSFHMRFNQVSYRTRRGQLHQLHALLPNRHNTRAGFSMVISISTRLESLCCARSTSEISEARPEGSERRHRARRWRSTTCRLQCEVGLDPPLIALQPTFLGLSHVACTPSESAIYPYSCRRAGSRIGGIVEERPRDRRGFGRVGT